MKCELCSWGASPESIQQIKSHIETHHYKESFDVVWKEKNFCIVREADKKDKVFEVGVVFYEAPKIPEKYVPKQYLDTETLKVSVKEIFTSNTKTEKQTKEEPNI